MGSGRKALSILLITGMITLVLICSIDMNAEAGPLTTVSIELDESVEIDVSPDAPASYPLKGNVICRSGSPNPVSVQLYVETSIGVVTLDKEEFVFNGGGNKTDEPFEQQYTLTLDIKGPTPVHFIEYNELLAVVLVGIVMAVGFIFYRKRM